MGTGARSINNAQIQEYPDRYQICHFHDDNDFGGIFFHIWNDRDCQDHPSPEN
jgi:hypothetical protein